MFLFFRGLVTRGPHGRAATAGARLVPSARVSVCVCAVRARDAGVCAPPRITTREGLERAASRAPLPMLRVGYDSGTGERAPWDRAGPRDVPAAAGATFKRPALGACARRWGRGRAGCSRVRPSARAPAAREASSWRWTGARGSTGETDPRVSRLRFGDSTRYRSTWQSPNRRRILNSTLLGTCARLTEIVAYGRRPEISTMLRLFWSACFSLASLRR